MGARKLMGGIGLMGLVAMIFFAVTSAMQDEAARPKPAAEPNFFPFLKPLDRTAQDIQSKSFGVPQPSMPDDAATAPTEVAAVQAAAQKMRAQGASTEEIDNMRAAALPPETAADLVRMEREEAAWSARLNAYLAERNRLLDGAADVPDPEREQVLQQLRDSRFTSEEQALLATYETSGAPQLTY